MKKIIYEPDMEDLIGENKSTVYYFKFARIMPQILCEYGKDIIPVNLNNKPINL